MERPAGVVDADLHNEVPDVRALFPYLAAHWREYIEQSGFKGPIDTAYPPRAPTSVRPDLRGDGARPATEVGRLVAEALEPWGTAIGILNCAYPVDSVHNPDAAAALASAVNDWQIAEWLEREPRLRASVVVPPQLPEVAAREIARVGGHPGFVQVLLPARSAAPYGNRRYLPIFEAAVAHDLVVGIVFGGAPGNPPTPVGWPTSYLEEYVGMAHVFQSQLISLICEGVFDRFRTLRVTLIEGGFTWLPSLLWRLDKDWKGLRREVPWVRRLPSEYVPEHVRFTLQPLDGPTDAAAWAQVFDQLGSVELLLFSTDYPHWQFDAPEAALPPGLPEATRRKIMESNARAWYRLGAA